MSCGESVISWVPNTGSAWVGTAGAVGMTAVFSRAMHAASTSVAGAPGAGTWSKNGDNTGFSWSVSINGATWAFSVNAESCDDEGNVATASGTATDGTGTTHDIDMTRTDNVV